MRIATFASTLLSLTIAAFFFLKVKQYDNAAKMLGNAIERKSSISSNFELRTLRNEVELKEVWDISQSIYGDDNVDFSAVVSWWKCYHEGIYVLFREHTIAAYLSMWPIKKQTFSDITKGVRRERELKPQSICGESYSKSRAYWYITNIVVKREFRKEKAVIHLLKMAFAKWLIDANLNNEIHICALGYSREGEAILKRFGFRKYKEPAETLDKLPLYINTFSRQDLNKILNRFDIQ